MAARRVVFVLAVCFAQLAFGQPRAVSDAESAAVAIVADYLTRGPAAVIERLDPASPLASLGGSVLPAEIEARLGPPRGAQWELQTVTPALANRMAAFTITYPSGLDDQVFFDLRPDGGAWRVTDIRFQAQPVIRKTLFPESATPKQNDDKPASAPVAPVGLAIAGAALSSGAAFMARSRGVARAMLAASGLMIIAAGALAITASRPAAAAATTAAAGPTIDTFAPIVELRRAIASGEGDVGSIFRDADRAAGRGAVADLWYAQARLISGDLAAAKSALAAFPAPSNRPLAETVRGRLALLDGDEASAAVAFANAVNLGPGRDGVWVEFAQALLALGSEERAQNLLRRLARLGTREADVYYQLAVMTAGDDEDEAERRLRTAWSLRPVTRERLIQTGAFWSLLRRDAVMSLIAFNATGEPVVTAPNLSARPLTFPAGAVVKTSGDFLGVTIADSELRVPGGAALAPVGTTVFAADQWEAEEVTKRIADLPGLLAMNGGAAAYAQPALRQRITGTAEALAARNRWADVVRLTDGLGARAEHVPPEVLFLRTVGLRRLARHDDAKRLAAELAASRTLQKKRDPRVFVELAELLEAQDLHDAAIRMYDRAQAIRPNAYFDDRARQILMNKRLETAFSVVRTRHFEVRHPQEVSTASAEAVANVMEKELARLQEWIPLPSPSTIVVNVLTWEDFRSIYTGSDFILGFYNGRITVPVAGASADNPFVVAVLGHELAHAMIAQATGDHAPKWFHEGLAQRIERRPYHANAFNMYDDTKLLPIAVLEAVLNGSPDPGMIGAAYVVAQTDIRYIEAKYGKAGIRTLIQAFASGATTSEAIQRLAGKSPAAFEVELRAWGRSASRVFDNAEAR